MQAQSAKKARKAAKNGAQNEENDHPMKQSTKQSILDIPSPKMPDFDVLPMPQPPAINLSNPSPLANDECVVHSMGLSLSRYPPMFTVDNRLILLPSAEFVRVHSVLTGACLFVLCGHTGDVTSIMHHPRFKLRVLTASLDGYIREWDLHTGACLKEYNIGQPIAHAVASSHHSNNQPTNHTSKNIKAPPADLIYLATNSHLKSRSRLAAQSANTSHNETHRSYRVLQYDIASSQSLVLYKARACTGLALSPNNTCLASISGHVLSLFDVNTKQRRKLTGTSSLTCLAFHPSDPYLATGDETGSIALWYRYETDQPVVSSLHWHAHAVAGLAFTPDGSYLLSGGEEAVLVIWHLDSGTKQFVSRLCGPLTHLRVSNDSLLYATAHADNAVRLLSAVTSKIEVSIQGSELAHEIPLKVGEASVAVTLLRSHVPGAVTISGRPGFLQLYDVFKDAHVADLDITQRNLVSRTNEALAAHYRVERAAYSPSHQWLVTVERRTDSTMTDKQVLRFHEFIPSTSTGLVPALHTRVDAPHGELIHDIALHPTLPVCATAAADRTFKVWQLHNNDSHTSLGEQLALQRNPAARASKAASHWACVAEGRYRASGIGSVAFNADGSLLAVAAGQVLTLWSLIPRTEEQPASLTLIRTILHPTAESPIAHVAFVAQSNPCCVITATPDCLFAWNAETGGQMWSWSAHVAGLEALQGGLVAVMTYEQINKNPNDTSFSWKNMTSSLLLFRPAESSKPFRRFPLADVRLERRLDSMHTFYASMCSLRPTAEEADRQFNSKFDEDVSIVYVNRRKALVRLDHIASSDVSKFARLPSNSQTFSMQTRPVSLFEQMYGKKALAENASDETTVAPTRTIAQPIHQSSGPFGSLFAAPSHLLPAVESLCMPFIESFMKPAAPSTNHQSNKQSSNAMDLDDEQQDHQMNGDSTIQHDSNEPTEDDLYEEVMELGESNNQFLALITDALSKVAVNPIEASSTRTKSKTKSKSKPTMNGHVANGTSEPSVTPSVTQQTPAKAKPSDQSANHVTPKPAKQANKVSASAVKASTMKVRPSASQVSASAIKVKPTSNGDAHTDETPSKKMKRSKV